MTNFQLVRLNALENFYLLTSHILSSSESPIAAFKIKNVGLIIEYDNPRLKISLYKSVETRKLQSKVILMIISCEMPRS